VLEPEYEEPELRLTEDELPDLPAELDVVLRPVEYEPLEVVLPVDELLERPYVLDELLREVEPETVPVEGVPLRVLVLVVVPTVLTLPAVRPVVVVPDTVPVVERRLADVLPLTVPAVVRPPDTVEEVLPAVPDTRRPLIEPVATALPADELVLRADALRPDVWLVEAATILHDAARRPTADEIAAVLRLPPE